MQVRYFSVFWVGPSFIQIGWFIPGVYAEFVVSLPFQMTVFCSLFFFFVCHAYISYTCLDRLQQDLVKASHTLTTTHHMSSLGSKVTIGSLDQKGKNNIHLKKIKEHQTQNWLCRKPIEINIDPLLHLIMSVGRLLR